MSCFHHPISGVRSAWSVDIARSIAVVIALVACTIGTPALDAGCADTTYVGFAPADGVENFNTIMEAYDAVCAGGTVYIASGSYAESIEISDANAKDGVTISGDPAFPFATTIITGGVRTTNSVDISGMTFSNLVLQGLATDANGVFDMDNGGLITDLTLDGVTIDGEGLGDRHGFLGQGLSGTVTVNGCTFENVANWAVFDSDSGGGAGDPGLTGFVFTNNILRFNDGGVGLRGHQDPNNLTATATIENNYVYFMNGVWSACDYGAGYYCGWAGIEVNYVDTVELNNNIIDDIIVNSWGEGQAFQVWKVNTLNMASNTVTNCYEGLRIYANVAGRPIPDGAVTGNSFSGNGYAIEVFGNADADPPLNALCNWYGDADGPNATGNPSAGDDVLGDVNYAPWLTSEGGSCDGGDCNGNGQYDPDDIAAGTSADCNGNSIPDECEADNDADGIPNDCDGDDDNDGSPDADDSDDNNPNVCSDTDGDGCDDCTNGSYDPNNDGPDSDGDGLCDSGDSDADGDGSSSADDSDDNNPNVCSDTDGDGCDDCTNGSYDPNNDGADFDGDGICDSGDDDDDNDGSPDPVDSDDNNPFVCSDNDGDLCDDCASGSYDQANDGTDTDGDGLCDAGDDDDDNDGVPDAADSDPTDPTLCSDTDGDGCEDCASGTYDPYNDGPDNDGDGQCNASDPDDDNDGSLDEDDSDDNNPFVCSDDDGDGCDDCSSGHHDPSDDGVDNDGDGQCNVGDPDDDNDGSPDADDSDDNNPNVCSDTDGDGCDDCTNGSYDPNNDGADFDGDGLCDAGDDDDDNDGSLDGDDSDDNNPNVCSDTDGDGCDDCTNGSYDPNNDGADFDGDGLCDAGDPDDDNDGIEDDCDTDITGGPDCNNNGELDSCEVASGSATDSDGDGILDECESFRRGDPNNDGHIDISDGIAILQELFASGPSGVCADASDVNDDGSIDIADPSYLLTYIFLGTAAPPAPFPDCGVDPTDGDGLTCDNYNCP